MQRDKKGKITKKYSDEYIKKLLDENKYNNISIAEISKRENIAKGTLEYRAKQLGYNIKSHKRKYDKIIR